MCYLETLYPSPRFPRPPAPDGSTFGKTPYVVAYTVAAGDYPVLEGYNALDAAASGNAGLAERIAVLQKRVEVIGVVGRECFAPRMTFALKDGRRVTQEYDGRELMWDFARDARELKRFVPALPILPAQYERFVAAVSGLERAGSVDDLVRLTVPS
jgi:hypothetical protein